MVFHAACFVSRCGRGIFGRIGTEGGRQQQAGGGNQAACRYETAAVAPFELFVTAQDFVLFVFGHGRFLLKYRHDIGNGMK